MRTPFKTIINPKNWFKKKDTVPGLMYLFNNLEQEDINKSLNRKRVWKERQAREEWGFGDKEVILLTIQSFITSYSSTIMFKHYGYFLYVKNINYVDCTVTFVFKHRFDEQQFTFHIFDFERVLLGCNKVIGMNMESTSYFFRQIKQSMEK